MREGDAAFHLVAGGEAPIEPARPCIERVHTMVPRTEVDASFREQRRCFDDSRPEAPDRPSGTRVKGGEKARGGPAAGWRIHEAEVDDAVSDGRRRGHAAVELAVPGNPSGSRLHGEDEPVVRAEEQTPAFQHGRELDQAPVTVHRPERLERRLEPERRSVRSRGVEPVHGPGESRRMRARNGARTLGPRRR